MVPPFFIQKMNKNTLLYVITFMMVSVFCAGLVSCGGDDEQDNGAILEYVGTWSCIYPATYQNSTIVTEGTILVITSSGDMSWTMSDGNRYQAKMRALGNDWADISYNGKTYRAEIYVNGNTLTINVNGNVDLSVKDFPFDGTYVKVR